MGSPTAAVVLNYRTPAITIRAVRSVLQEEPSIIPVVVDNASGDGSATLFHESLPDVRCIASEANLGFSGGCNLGIAEALRLGADRVLLLNGDVVVLPDALAALQRTLDADDRCGIVGPVLVSSADPELVQSRGIRYSRTTGRMRHHGFGDRLQPSASTESQEVDAVSGAAMLIRRKVFERIGLLAEEFFFGFEDLEFCLRARAVGFHTACIRAAIVRHDGSASIGRASPRRIYFATRNHLLLASRHPGLGARPGRALTAASILVLNLAHVLLTSEVPRMAGLRALVHGARDHARAQYGPAPSGAT
ncbi:MAG: glycosyltransferase family 2 protein [Vicinamibacterales bacterium]